MRNFPRGVFLFLAAASATATNPAHLPRQANCLAQCRTATRPSDNPDFCTSTAWIKTFNDCLSCAEPAHIADTFIGPIQYLGSRCGYNVEFPSPNGEENQTPGTVHALPLPAGSSEHKPRKISIPAIACGVTGATLALAALFILILFLDRRRKKRQQLEQHECEVQQMKNVSDIFGFARSDLTRPHRSATMSTSETKLKSLYDD
ncbi:hypothetical protein BST61_g2761 [Cercospora zeina]